MSRNDFDLAIFASKSVPIKVFKSKTISSGFYEVTQVANVAFFLKVIPNPIRIRFGHDFVVGFFQRIKKKLGYHDLMMNSSNFNNYSYSFVYEA